MSGPLPATNKPNTSKPGSNKPGGDKPKPNKPNRGISDRNDDRGRGEAAGQTHPADVAAERDDRAWPINPAVPHTRAVGDVVAPRPVPDPPVGAR